MYISGIKVCFYSSHCVCMCVSVGTCVHKQFVFRASSHDHTHSCHGNTQVPQPGEEFVGIPVSVVDSRPHLHRDGAVGNLRHSSHNRIKPCATVHE